MNCFEITKNILDRSFAQIEGTQEEKIKKINKRITELRVGYGDLDSQHGFDYEDPVTQFAYIYKYTTAHANYVYQLLKMADRDHAIPKAGTVHLASIGGGPGSDFLGFLKFYSLSSYSEISIISNSFDKDSCWSFCWHKVFEEAHRCSSSTTGCITLSTTFHMLDVCDTKSTTRFADFTNSDVFTMTYFMSEVFYAKNDADHFFSYLFENIKKDSVVLFIDNKTPKYRNWFDSYIGKNNYDVLISGEDRWFPPTDEEKTTLGDYLKMFEKPKIQSEIAYRVARKL